MTTFQSALVQLSTAQKPKNGISLYSRFINRPLGRLLAAALHTAGVSPNQVTILSALSTTGGLVLLISQLPTVGVGVLVSALLILGFALDSADGQVARLAGRSSPEGEWLDHVVDAGKMVAVHGGVLVALWVHMSKDTPWLLVPLAFQLVATLMFAGGTLVDLIERSLPQRQPADRKPVSAARAAALLPADFGVLALTFALWGITPAFLVSYGLLLVTNTVIALLLLGKWFRKLATLGLTPALDEPQVQG